MPAMHTLARRTALLALVALCIPLTGCETSGGKKIEYKSVSNAPSIEIPPDLTTPRGRVASCCASARRRAAAQESRCAHRARGQRALAGGQGDTRTGVGAGASVLDGTGIRDR